MLSVVGVRVNQRLIFPQRPLLLYAFRVEPAGGERKSADVEQKTVTLIYPYPCCGALEDDCTEKWTAR